MMYFVSSEIVSYLNTRLSNIIDCFVLFDIIDQQFREKSEFLSNKQYLKQKKKLFSLFLVTEIQLFANYKL